MEAGQEAVLAVLLMLETAFLTLHFSILPVVLPSLECEVEALGLVSCVSSFPCHFPHAFALLLSKTGKSAFSDLKCWT